MRNLFLIVFFVLQLTIFNSCNEELFIPEENHCYENAVAERVNGILKDEFYLDQTFSNLEMDKKVTKNAIKLYNSIRLQVSLDYQPPENVYKSIA